MQGNPGWDDFEAFRAEDRADRDEVLDRIDIEELSEHLGVQIHGDGLTCPNPDHHQTGDSAPASTFTGSDDGLPRWHCHACGVGGTAIDFVIQAGEAEDYRSALDLLASPDGLEPRSRPARRRSPYREPADRRRPTGWALVEPWMDSRGWPLDSLRSMFRWPLRSELEWVGIQLLDGGGRHFLFEERLVRPPGLQVEPVRDEGGIVLRVWSDPERTWWQDGLVGEVPEGQSRWRSPAGRESHLFTWEPDYTTKRRTTAYDREAEPHRVLTTDEHTPDPLPRVLVVEGASDFITAVVAQHSLRIEQRFPVVGLAGVWATRLLDEGHDYCFVFDNDKAGEQARERVEGHHLFVPEQFGDLSDWYQAEPHPWEWVKALVAAKEEA